MENGDKTQTAEIIFSFDPAGNTDPLQFQQELKITERDDPDKI